MDDTLPRHESKWPVQGYEEIKRITGATVDELKAQERIRHAE